MKTSHKKPHKKRTPKQIVNLLATRVRKEENAYGHEYAVDAEFDEAREGEGLHVTFDQSDDY